LAYFCPVYIVYNNHSVEVLLFLYTIVKDLNKFLQ
jgi:hypothetical protein